MMKFIFMTLIAECCAFNHVSLTNVTLTIAPECMELLKLQKDPLDCCIYPKLEADSTLSKKCKIECPSRQRGNYNCCYRACLFTKSGIYGDEKFSHEVCKGFFTFNGIQFNIQEKWREIVKESLKKCESEVVPSNMTTADSCIPNYIHEIITCSWKENFINCPRFSNDKICNEMKPLVTECAKTDGKFIFYNFFFSNQKSGTSFS